MYKRQYTIFIKSNNQNLSGNLEFLDESDNLIYIESLKRTASFENIHTYSKKINIDNSFSNVKKLKFYLKDINNFTSKEEILDIEVRKEALISNVKTLFKEFYRYETYVERGTNVQYELWGTPGFNALAKLNYKDLDGIDQALELNLVGDSKGYYKLQASLPLDIASIRNIEYFLTDPRAPENTITKIDEKSRTLGGQLNFTGLKNDTGDYNGKTISLNSSSPWFNKQITIKDNESSLVVKGLPPSDAYTYYIYDLNKTYDRGSIVLASGEDKNVNLSQGLTPAKLKFVVSPQIENLKIYVSNYGYLQNNLEYGGFIEDESINYSLNLSEKDFKTYKMPTTSTATMNTGLNQININLEPFEKITYSGTIVDEKLPTRRLDRANVSFRQYIPNGLRQIYYNDNVTSDENGNFEIELYKDYPVYFYIGKDGYDLNSFDLEKASQENLDLIGNIGLSYSTKNQISVNLFGRPLLGLNGDLNTSDLLGLDNNKISYITATDIDNKPVSAYFNHYNSSIYLSGNNANKSLRIKFHFYDMKMEESYYEVNLDGYGNGLVNPVALSSGVVKANVMTSGDNSPTAYMMLYDANNKLAGLVSGSGTISSESLVLENGSYTAILLKGYDLNKLNNMKTIEAFELLDIEENLHYIRRNIVIGQNKLTDLGDIRIPEITLADVLSISQVSIKTRFIPNNGNGLVHVLARFNPELVDPESSVSLNYVRIFSSGTILDNQVFFNGREHYGSSIYVGNDTSEDQILFFTLVPPSMEQLDLTIRLDYLVDGEIFVETFGVDNIDAPKVSLLAPSEVFMGDDAKEITVRGLGLPESTIQIYDNNRLIGETTIPAKKFNYQTSVSLIDRDIPVAHTLHAKMITKDNEEYISSTKICEIIDPKVMAYTSNFVFQNGHNTITTDNPKDSSENVIFSYVPYKDSVVSFHINNLLNDQLDYVALLVTSSGEEIYYEADHVEDVVNGENKYSKWAIQTRLREVGDFSVYYSLKTDESLAPISGSKPIDFQEAIASPDIDPAYIPTAIRDNLENRQISKNSNSELDVTVPVQGGGYVRVTGTFSENHRITEAELKSQGYRRFDTEQGYYWAKEALRNDGTNLEFNKSIYFSPELTQILKGDTYASRLNNIPNNLLAMAYTSDSSTRILSQMVASTTVDDTLSKADYAGYVFGIGEIVNDTSPNPANFGKVGTSMQVVGGVVLAGQILSGPSSKDHNILYETSAKIDDAMIRSRIGDEIREYDRARRSSHTVSTLFGGVSYGASFGGFVGKGLSYIVSTGGMIYGQKTGAELDIWWDAVMRDIQNELTLQEARKNKKDKPPKPGKKDDQKKPNWKIDPSGYVFEAIDSNRIEGVTASALVNDPLLEDFLFWDEAEDWNETNPVLSDQDGKYGWDVPPGDWKVRFEKEGYLTSQTKSMTVPPAHEEVNIGLLSTKAPRVSGLAMDSGGIEIEFDIFMQGETLLDNISVLDRDGVLVPYEGLDFLIATEDTVYKGDRPYQEDIVASSHFVKRVRLLVDEDLYPGGFKLFEDDGETPAKYNLIIRENVQSYAGVQINEDFIQEDIQVVERQIVENPSANIPEGDYTREQSISLRTTTEGATIYYTLDGSDPSGLSPVYKGPITISKSTILKFFASNVGMDNSEIVSLRYNIVTILPDYVEETPPTPPTPGGDDSTGESSIEPSPVTQNKNIVTKTRTFLENAMKNNESKIKFVLPLAEITLSPRSIESLLQEKGSIFSIEVKKVKDDISIVFKMDNKTIDKIDGDILVTILNLNPNISTVVMKVNSDGSLQIIPKSIIKDKSMIISLNGSATIRIVDNKKSFKDTEKHWARDAIQYVAARELFGGTDIGSFSPELPMTRGMLVTVLHRLENKVKSPSTAFEDVDLNKYYAPAIDWASHNKIVQGLGKNIFGPDQEITREQLVVMIYRYAGVLGLNTSIEKESISGFPDSNQVSSWASKAMNHAINQGLIKGKDGKLDPKGYASRAEVATILQRLVQIIYDL